eukprot:scaffold107587_cov33-Phaeocystis_antarctica.AAC.1
MSHACCRGGWRQDADHHPALGRCAVALQELQQPRLGPRVVHHAAALEHKVVAELEGPVLVPGCPRDEGHELELRGLRLRALEARRPVQQVPLEPLEREEGGLARATRRSPHRLDRQLALRGLGGVDLGQRLDHRDDVLGEDLVGRMVHPVGAEDVGLEALPVHLLAYA